MVGTLHLTLCRPELRGRLLCALSVMIVATVIPNALQAQTPRPFADESGRLRQTATRPSRSSRPANRVAERPSSRFSDVRPITPSAGQSGASAGKAPSAHSGPSIWKTFGALGLIVAVIVIVGRMWKKLGPKLSGGLPSEAIDILGKRTIDARQAIYLVRLGSRILVLGSTANGLRTLSEVTDPVEVDYLSGLSRQNDADNGVSQSFRALFSGQNVLNSDRQPAASSAVIPSAESQATDPINASREILSPGRPHV